MPQHPAAAATVFAPICEWAEAHCRAGAAQVMRDALDAAEMLREVEMDESGLAAALLQPLLPLAEKEESAIAARFGAAVLPLLRGAARMKQLSALSGGAGNPVNEENLRKMLIVMVDDVRVVLIELARHLSVLRGCKRADAQRQNAIGRATLDVYAPLAGRLGVRQWKWQMEDYALRFLEPGEYRGLAELLAETRLARENYIRAFTAALDGALRAAGINAEVQGRPKHLYSIWKKMRRKNMPFEQLHDLRAVRILAGGVADCYAALAAVHAHWPRMQREFDDYIATPKDNGYRSIHTVVTGPEKKRVEVQIRTHEMHRESELGVAAHWRYKENARADDGIDRKILRLRQLLEWQEELRDAGALQPAPPGARVYVFTPKGTVIDLPEGATAIDFAYAVHTEVGHAIRGARVDGKIAPLGRKLQTGEQVQVQTAKGGRPSRDWLRAELQLVRTQRARGRIARWFKAADYAQHAADGRAILERELSRLGLKDLAYDKIARAAAMEKTDDLLAALGAGDVTPAKALAPFRRMPPARPAAPP
ncbi:MAG: HD domain-containing protein, partial [Gammaproteobacteria bacterium]